MKKLFFSILMLACLSVSYCQFDVNRATEKAKAGDTAAMLNLYYYYFGLQEYETAVQWLQPAAEAGNPSAITSLAKHYCFGRGVTPSYEKSMELALKSDKLGIPYASFLIGMMYIDEEWNNFDMGKAFQWFLHGAELGDPQCQDWVGDFYNNGWGVVEQSATDAFKWYYKAALQGHEDAQRRTGIFFLQGYGVEKDEAKGINWIRKAIGNGCINAKTVLAKCYSHGWGVGESTSEAFRLAKEAAEEGDPEAMDFLAMLYSEGTGCEKSDIQSFYWYYKAAENGWKPSMLVTADNFYNGIGVKKSDADAIFWIKQAASKGNKLAQDALQHRGDENANALMDYIYDHYENH